MLSGSPLCSREGLGLSSSKSITHWATVASPLLPSLRPGICHPHVPSAPYGFRKAPSIRGAHYGLQGAALPRAWTHVPSFLPGALSLGGEEGRRPTPRGWWYCPGPASRLWRCTPPCGADPLLGVSCQQHPHPGPPLASVHHGLQHLQEELMHGHLALQLHPIEMGQHFACRLAQERQGEE